MTKVLFVCTGNTCRSPLAEALLKQKRPDLKVKSAGVSALAGMEASEGAKQVLAQRGIITNHLSSIVDKKLMDWADLVLTLTVVHKQMLLKQFPEYTEKIFTLKEYALNDEEIEVEKRLQNYYSQVERKQEDFFHKNKEEIEHLNKQNDPQSKKQLDQLKKQFNDLLEDDRKEIATLEKQLPSLDISDPFGGNIDVYKRTEKEIEAAIDKIIGKINDGTFKNDT